MDATRYKIFQKYCNKFNIAEEEGKLGALAMTVPRPRRAAEQRYVLPLEIRNMAPHTLNAIFRSAEYDMDSLMQRVACVERAHILWQSCHD